MTRLQAPVRTWDTPSAPQATGGCGQQEPELPPDLPQGRRRGSWDASPPAPPCSRGPSCPSSRVHPPGCPPRCDTRTRRRRRRRSGPACRGSWCPAARRRRQCPGGRGPWMATGDRLLNSEGPRAPRPAPTWWLISGSRSEERKEGGHRQARSPPRGPVFAPLPSLQQKPHFFF